MGDGEELRLSPQARKRIVELGADAIGRLRQDELPAALRPMARFTFKSLVQRGGVAIAASLDADDEFRGRVAEAVEQALPALAAAVRGGDTVASDPSDVAAAAFLLRPDGWADLVAADVARWEQQQAAGEGARDERDRLRAEVAELKARLRAEDARRRGEIKEATAAAGAEVAALRRDLRVRTGVAREAERARDEAQRALAAEREAAERAAAAADAELRKLRARLAELERAATGERRAARAERDLDDARLAVLVDTLQRAAAGIRTELALPPTQLRPADAAGAVDEAAPGRTVDDARALDALLRAPRAHLIVDGYNVSKTGYAELDLAAQRQRLVGALAALAGRTRAEVTVAFDGNQQRAVGQRAPRGVRVQFSAGESADDLIRRLVAAEPAGRGVVVVTSDAAIVTDIRAAGHVTAPSAVLLALLG